MSEPEFKTITYGKLQFEKRRSTIYNFTKDFLHRNQERPLPTTRQEVNWHWEQQIMNTYPKNDDPMRVLLLEQESCPLIESLWERRADEEAFKKKRAQQRESGFYVITRKRTAAECKRHQLSVIMTHETHGDLIIPGILIRPLNRISYLDLVRKILMANPTKDLDHSVLHELWNAIITKIYDYEYDWREQKKLEGVNTSDHEYDEIVTDIAHSKKRQHSEVEEGSGDSDARLSKTKHAKKSANHAKALKASSSSDTTMMTIKGKVPAKASKAAENSVVSKMTSSAIKVSIPAVAIKAEKSTRNLSEAGLGTVVPPPPVSVNPVAARGTNPRPSNTSLQPTLGSNTRSVSSALSIPPSTRLANAAPARVPTTNLNTAQPFSRHRGPPHSPSQASDINQLSSREIGMPNSGVAPWPYDPQTGEKTNGATFYRLSDREENMLRHGIPPWPYDPSTGVKTRILTTNVWKV